MAWGLTVVTDQRTADLCRFYQLLARLEVRVCGTRHLKDCSKGSGWPERGVYFFFEQGEIRSGSGSGLRVVRVGTHAITGRSKTTLWNRLSQHRGAENLGGNHRASVFRKLVGRALTARYSNLAVPTWGINSSAALSIRVAERPLEEEVSRYISAMPFLWLSVEDSPSPSSRRALIERNSIALLSNATLGVNAEADPPSSTWLGLDCPHTDVRESGLWNSRHVHEIYNPAFLDELDRLVS